MQARLNSLQAFKMVDKMLERTEKNVCRLEQLVLGKCGKERKRVGYKCCAAANSNNQAKTKLIYHSATEIPSDKQGACKEGTGGTYL